MVAGLIAGLFYFGTVFAAGVALGAVRVTLLVPAMGEFGAVLVELPVILGLAWLAAGWAVRRFDVPVGLPRLVMGEVAFVLLIGAEFALGVALGRPPGAVVAGWATPAGALGLAGQVVFGALPWLRGRLGVRRL